MTNYDQSGGVIRLERTGTNLWDLRYCKLSSSSFARKGSDFIKSKTRMPAGSGRAW